MASNFYRQPLSKCFYFNFLSLFYILFLVLGRFVGVSWLKSYNTVLIKLIFFDMDQLGI